MALITLICPHCGGDFELDPDRSLQPYWVCPYCGNRSLMQKGDNTVRLRGIISGKTSQTSYASNGQPAATANGQPVASANGQPAATANGQATAAANGDAAAKSQQLPETRPAPDHRRAGFAPQTQSAEAAAFLAGTPLHAPETRRSLAEIIAEAVAEPTDTSSASAQPAGSVTAGAAVDDVTAAASAAANLAVVAVAPVMPGMTHPGIAAEIPPEVAGSASEPSGEPASVPTTAPVDTPVMTDAAARQPATAPAASPVRPIITESLPRQPEPQETELEVFCQLAEAAANRHDMPLFNSYSRRAIDLQPTDPRMYAWRAILIEEAGGFARSTWTTPLWLQQVPSRKMAIVAQHFYNLSTALRFCQETRRPEQIRRIAGLVVKQAVDHFHEHAVLRCRQNLLFKTFKGHYRSEDLRASAFFVDAVRQITPDAFPTAQPELLEALRGEIRLLPPRVGRRLLRF